MLDKAELLLPAGSLVKLKTAILYGADAVYLGGKLYGLRALGGNFTKEELREAVEFAHKLHKKVYVTSTSSRTTATSRACRTTCATCRRSASMHCSSPTSASS